MHPEVHMAFLTWSDQFLLGNNTIDSEHRELFQQIGTFHDLWKQRQSPEELSKRFAELVAFIETHFRHEEAIMARVKFPQLKEHRFLHRMMLETIQGLQQAYEKKTFRLEEDTMIYLKNWLIEHIMERDHQLREYLPPQQS
jgi:hemerythrin-like metal-binding protein